MPPKRAQCQICNENESKYTCSACMIVYCSVPCFKKHKETSCSAASRASGSSIFRLDSEPPKPQPDSEISDGSRQDRGAKPSLNEQSLDDVQAPLKPLTSLKWPYIPEESEYPDPLKRDDPKQLQLPQYESIATSQTVRKVLASNPKLPDLLRTIDRLRGEDREEELQRALGVSRADLDGQFGRNRRVYSEEDVNGIRELAEAIEAAVRGGKEDVLGLNWGD
ncbi:hypothetical protein BDY19DRAFT_968841 [Irpex rosettiformis]|uniref:Uncharacterized protein n=1 Tax=Irpex rosettiformis TaxID=378272 RepID=A0ACB8TSG0_9APHY|nr:hypothetical protein BDY19DRAFT_968841 [Irpex rosettiformis]